jgi:SAM-dependent methyltransferase
MAANPTGGVPGRLRRQLAKRGGKLRPRTDAEQPQDPQMKWFWDHYGDAAKQIESFCRPAGSQLADAKIADVGCGDGIMALGFFELVRPNQLVGFDINPVSTERLQEMSAAAGVSQSLPSGLEFRVSQPTSIPAETHEFDFVYSWSAFEHIADPLGVLKEIRRILRPGGHFFLQLWPFYHSSSGSHLWDWFDDDFHHLVRPQDELLADVNGSQRHSPEWTGYMTKEFEHLNRITLDELQRCVLAAGLYVAKLELLTAPAHLTPALARYSWADLGVGGIKLIAVP